MKKTEYKVVSGPEGIAQLEEKVGELLGKGWKPVGGVAFNADCPYQALARVIVKKTALSQQDVPPERKH